MLHNLEALGALLWKLLTRIVRVRPARDGEAEGEGRQNGDAIVCDITPLQRISINKMLENFQRYSHEENTERPEDFLTAGFR